MILFGHRGARAIAPENTLLSFQTALDAGCEGIELDVQLSHDGALVIIHDETVDRTTNGSGAISDMTLAEIQALDAGGGQHIPTLAEYFDLVQNTAVITNIELKNNVKPYPGLEEKVLEQVRQRGMAGRVLFSSFNHDAVKHMRRLAPDIPAGFLCGAAFDLDAVAASMKEHGVQYLHPALRLLDDALLAELGKRGIPFNVWTVNEDADIRRLRDAGAHGIFTDDPARAQNILAEE